MEAVAAGSSNPNHFLLAVVNGDESALETALWLYFAHDIRVLDGVLYCPQVVELCEECNGSHFQQYEGPLGAVECDVVRLCESSGMPAVLVKVDNCTGSQNMSGRYMRFSLKALVKGLCNHGTAG